MVEEQLQKMIALSNAYKEGKILQSLHHDGWHDFVPKSKASKPNLDYAGLDIWRIKPEIEETVNAETSLDDADDVENTEILDIIIKQNKSSKKHKNQ